MRRLPLSASGAEGKPLRPPRPGQVIGSRAGGFQLDKEGEHLFAECVLDEQRLMGPANFDDGEALLDAVMAGASGYVLKLIRGCDLVAAVRTVGSGRSMLDASAADRLMSRLRGTTERSPRRMLCTV